MSAKKKKPPDLKPDMEIEVLFELRFSGRSEAVSSVLLAMFQSGAFKRRFPVCKRFFMEDVPRSIKRGVPEFRHMPSFILQGAGEKIFIGDQVFAFVIPKAHVGGDKLTEKLTKIISAVAKEKEEIDIKQITLRTSVKTDQGADDGLDRTRFKGAIGKYDLAKNNDVEIKLRVSKKNLFHTVRMRSNGIVEDTAEGDKKNGVLRIDIATEQKFDSDVIWSDSAETIKKLFAAERTMLKEVMKKELLGRCETDE